MQKFRAVAKKMAKNCRGYFFAAHCRAAIIAKLENAVTLNFAPKTKMGINTFSMGICLAKC